MRKQLSEISALLQKRQIHDAEVLCHRLTQQYPNSEHGWLLLGQICKIKGDLKGMLDHTRTGLSKAPDASAALLKEAEASMLCGELKNIGDKLLKIEQKESGNAHMLQQVAILYTHLERHADALRCYTQARNTIGDKPELLYNCATAATALGDLEEAEVLLDKVIELNPLDYAAYYNRAVLRKQSQANNHIEQMEAVLLKQQENSDAKVQLGYALAKEYEDLGKHAQSFTKLKAAADARKKMLSYSVEGDVATMEQIAEAMNNSFFTEMPTTDQGSGPIFIVGQPRSGTTLVDRILSSHSQVESLGEINDFAQIFTQAIGAVQSKSELVLRSTTLDFELVGKQYLTSTKARNAAAPFLVDKTPANSLYIGLIAKALPNAKIIHLCRNPMDTCYAMYKTLFRMGYPYSYSLEDLGTYYVAYFKLMQHWREHLPGRILDLNYESLVQNQESESRRLLEHCGLEWQESCLDFYKNSSASATASAAQVRQPMYQSSIEKWREYKDELAPLYAILQKAEIVA